MTKATELTTFDVVATHSSAKKAKSYLRTLLRAGLSAKLEQQGAVYRVLRSITTRKEIA